MIDNIPRIRIKSDKQKIVAMQFFCAFYQSGELPFEGAFAADIVADLNELPNLCSSACDEIHFLVIAGAIIEDRLFFIVTTAAKFQKDIILKQMSKVFAAHTQVFAQREKPNAFCG